MSLNIFDSTESIEFTPDKPTTCYGWHLSGNDSEISLNRFESEDLKHKYVAAVREELAPLGLGDDDCKRLAVLAFFSSHADEEWQQELAFDEAMTSISNNLFQQAWEIAKAYADANT